MLHRLFKRTNLQCARWMCRSKQLMFINTNESNHDVNSLLMTKRYQDQRVVDFATNNNLTLYGSYYSNMHENAKTSITMAEVEELLSKKNDIINHLNTAAIKQYIEDKSGYWLDKLTPCTKF